MASKIEKAKKDAKDKMEEWLKNPEKVEEEKIKDRDFRDAVVMFGEEDEIDKYFIYKAIGYRNSRSKFSDDAKGIYKRYVKDGKIRYAGEEADSCPLMEEIYEKLWDEHHRKHCEKSNEQQRLTGDTMNSCTTVLNYLVEKEWIPQKKIYLADDIKNAQENPKKKQRWSALKAISQYCQDLHLDPEGELALKDAIKEHGDDERTLRWGLKNDTNLKEFLRVCYTIGNFIPVPEGCNVPRGDGLTQDSWPLALKCIYDWYEISSVEKKQSDDRKRLECKKQSLLAKLLNYNQNAMDRYRVWLESFRTWDNFVIENYLQDYIQDYSEQGAPHYGPPKEFWDGHFNGAPLPVTTGQFQSFFSHATACIKARSERMVNALQRKLKYPQKKAEMVAHELANWRHS